jgi:hypothetical protein
LVAANPNDQQALSSLPFNTDLDIKVRDNPKTVADLVGKVLSFLGASATAQNASSIVIKNVVYAAATCPQRP